jgi:hypothetical protein
MSTPPVPETIDAHLFAGELRMFGYPARIYVELDLGGGETLSVQTTVRWEEGRASRPEIDPAPILDAIQARYERYPRPRRR